MSRYGRFTCAIHSISSQTSQESIICTKAEEQLRSYCPNIYCGFGGSPSIIEKVTSHVTSHCEIGYDRSLGVENCPVCCVKGGALLIMNIKTLHKDEFLSDVVHCIVTN